MGESSALTFTLLNRAKHIQSKVAGNPQQPSACIQNFKNESFCVLEDGSMRLGVHENGKNYDYTFNPAGQVGPEVSITQSYQKERYGIDLLQPMERRSVSLEDEKRYQTFLRNMNANQFHSNNW